MKNNTIGLDIAKKVFQAHWVEEETGEICQEELKRSKVLEFFAKRTRSLVAMEAGGSSHYWAREIGKLGHKVVLIAPHLVRPYVKTNKTDEADAEAIWTAAQQRGMRFVAVKNEGQQAVLVLHRQRQQLVKFRTMQVNQVRGILYEFGEILPEGRLRMMKEVPRVLANAAGRVPGVVLEAVRSQLVRLRELGEEIKRIETQLLEWKKGDEAAKRLAEIPGVGLLTSTALVATMGSAGVFKSGREFAAFLGLVPKQSGTGGRVRLLGMSKRGDVYLRTLLIHGARSVIAHGRKRRPWLQKLIERRPLNVAAVALANKMARTAWALLAYGRVYQEGYVSPCPAGK